MSEPRATLEYSQTSPHGRMLAISELLRLGHPIAAVVEAVRLADQGDLHGALARLTTALSPAAVPGKPPEGTEPCAASC